MPNPLTTHSDRVAGWSILGLFGFGSLAMLLAAFAPHLDPSSKTALIVIGSGCASAVAGSLMPRGSTPDRTPADALPQIQQTSLLPADPAQVLPSPPTPLT